MSARQSRYKRDNKGTNNKRPCSGCGSFEHGQKGANDRPTHCPAWGTVCHNCDIPNHFTKVCRQTKKKDGARAISIVQAMEDKIRVSISPSLPRLQQHPPSSCKVFPDSGASICLAGTIHLPELNIKREQLIPCSKQITVVGGSTLTCFGWLPMTFSIDNLTSRQALFFCEEADRIYLSRKACIDLSILPPSYPHPMKGSNKETVHSIESLIIPDKPKIIPFPATEDNINNLKQHLISKFRDTAFSKSTPFPSMDTKPVHIHVKPDAKPFAHHVPIPVPFHWKAQVKQDLDNDISRKIIEPVPIRSPVE